jgi:hypothetical protein
MADLDDRMSLVDVREFRPADIDACRRLYAQLVEHHREIYGDVTIGGDDPGSGFDEHLATPQRVTTWVATDGDDIVAMTGLLWEGGESTIEPVVVDRSCRRTGVGRREWDRQPTISGGLQLHVDGTRIVLLRATGAGTRSRRPQLEPLIRS